MKHSHQHFLKLASKVAQKSGCVRGKRGAVFVRNNEILIKSYNSVLPSNDFCLLHGCLRDRLKLGMGKELEKCRSIHAEAQAVCLAAKKNICLNHSTAYITCMPCMNCAKLMISVGIKKIYYLDLHGDHTSLQLLSNMGVKCIRVTIQGDDASTRLRDTSGQ